MVMVPGLSFGILVRLGILRLCVGIRVRSFSVYDTIF
jgi:hypothetical protein